MKRWFKSKYETIKTLLSLQCFGHIDFAPTFNCEFDFLVDLLCEITVIQMKAFKWC